MTITVHCGYLDTDRVVEIEHTDYGDYPVYWQCHADFTARPMVEGGPPPTKARCPTCGHRISEHERYGVPHDRGRADGCWYCGKPRGDWD